MILKHLALVTFLLLATRALAAPAPLPDLSTFPNSLGVNLHFTDPKPGELDQIYRAGFRWVRMDFAWNGIERKKGEYDFSAYDRLVAALDEHHIKAYFILDYSNRNYDDDLSPHTDEGRAAFAKWAAESVRHFKGHGIIWEMYNEPNIQFWRPVTNVDDYAKLALEVGKSLRDAEPGEIYIGPACSTIDLPFLESCFKAGCLEYWSAVSVHPYRQKDPETVADEYRKVRQLIAKYAPKDRTIPIISGEWGYSSVWDKFDEDRQAKYLPREVLTNIANDVPLSIWYDWHEDGKDPKEGEHHFGIVRPDAVNKDGNLYEPKKAYLAAKRMSEMLEGFHFNKRLATGADNYAMLFSDAADKQVIVEWTTSRTSEKLNLPITSEASAKDAFGGGMMRVPKGVAIIPDEFPTYVIPSSPEPFLRIAAAWSRLGPEVAVAGPGTAKFQTTVKNPLDKPITILQGEKRIALKPGETTTVDLDVNVGRQGEKIPVTVSLDVEGLGKIQQESAVTVTNPLIVHFLPRFHDMKHIRFDNPSGDPLNAEARVTSESDDYISFAASMKKGQAQHTESVLMPEFDGRDIQTGLKLVDNFSLQTLIDIQPMRYDMVAGFAANPVEGWKVVPDGDANVKSDQTLVDAHGSIDDLAPGMPTAELSYRFDSGWKFIRVVPADASKAKIDGVPTSLGIWVHGDNQGNIARMRFTDSTGQTFQPDGGRITWTGWHYVEFNLTAGDIAHWGGANDGTVHFPIKIDTLFLLDSHDRHATKGEIYLSAPTLVYEK